MFSFWPKSLTFPRKAALLSAIFFLAILLFTRFYNLEKTARFTGDEASDLVRMQEMYQARKITLVGPISNDNSKVFGSLTYYMLLPFVVPGNFHPISPVVGTAFYGVLTAGILIGITWLVNRKLIKWVALLALVWYPLVEISRWAWNPHYMVFWIALGILAYVLGIQTKKRPYKLAAFFVSGMMMALAFHNHYLAVFATSVWVGLVGINELRAKNWQSALALGIGFVLPFLPFVIFDLRHPPGLFFAKYLFSSTPDVIQPTLAILLGRFFQNYQLLTTFIATSFMSGLVAVLLPLLAILDRKKITHLVWLLPVIVQLMGGAIVVVFATRYILPALPFLLVWLILPRTGVTNWVAKFILGLCIISSLISIWPQLTQTKVPPDIYTINAAANIIQTQITEHSLKNPNIAALVSPDSDPLSGKYRYLLQTRNIHFKAASEYNATENLFVISTAPLEPVQADVSAPMVYFAKTDQHQTFHIPNSEWMVHWFYY